MKKKQSSKSVVLVEVGLRDGLQNEKTIISTNDKIALAQKLQSAGLERLELGSFVRPDLVPQMADSLQVIDAVLSQSKKKIKASALVPNERGMRDALQTQLKEVSIFASCSESFSQKNINCSMSESLKRFIPVLQTARQNRIRVRGYLSVCFGCPYEGKVSPQKVLMMIDRLFELGCYEVSLGDTIGVANPQQVGAMLEKIERRFPLSSIAGHFHDTRGTALANILKAYECGVSIFDSSLGGLGGCPYAPGAAGNVATEDVVYMFQGMGKLKSIELAQLIEASRFIGSKIDRVLPSKVTQAGIFKPRGKIF